MSIWSQTAQNATVADPYFAELLYLIMFTMLYALFILVGFVMLSNNHRDPNPIWIKKCKQILF